jgi:hypothetical protein
MGPGNVKMVKDWQTSQNRLPAAIEGRIVKSDEQIISVPIPARKGLHLDVDEILRHSLPNVSQPTFLRRVNKRTPR